MKTAKETEYPISKERKYDLQETDGLVAILFASIETDKMKKGKWVVLPL